MLNEKNNRIILFDGVCNLCIGIVRFTIKYDPHARFRFVSLQSDIGKTLLLEYSLPIDSLDTFVYIKNRKAYIKSTAGLMVLKDLGWPFKLSYFFVIMPKALRDRIYDWIAKSRYNRFGKRDTCMVPDQDTIKRFLK